MSRTLAMAADQIDAQIFAKARSALDGRLNVPATVRVHVSNAVITLTGSVRLPSQRAAAEDAVRDAAGPRHLVNRIIVPPINPEGVEPPDNRD